MPSRLSTRWRPAFSLAGPARREDPLPNPSGRGRIGGFGATGGGHHATAAFCTAAAHGWNGTPFDPSKPGDASSLLGR